MEPEPEKQTRRSDELSVSREFLREVADALGGLLEHYMDVNATYASEEERRVTDVASATLHRVHDLLRKA